MDDAALRAKVRRDLHNARRLTPQVLRVFVGIVWLMGAVVALRVGVAMHSYTRGGWEGLADALEGVWLSVLLLLLLLQVYLNQRSLRVAGQLLHEAEAQRSPPPALLLRPPGSAP